MSFLSSFGKKSRPYQYTPLNEAKREIRLLYVVPPKRDRKGKIAKSPIRAELHVVSLDTKPAYTTISYAWSREESKPNKLQLGDGTLEIPSAVHEMILHITAPMSPVDKIDPQLMKWVPQTALWIDQICINQHEPEDKPKEKEAQVRLMDEIYKNSNNTIIWLGPAGPHTKRAMAFLQQGALGSLLTSLETNLKSEASSNPLISQSLASRTPDLFDPTLWRALRDLLCAKWWTRTWIIQEVLLSVESWVLSGAWGVSIDKFHGFQSDLAMCKVQHVLPTYVRNVFRSLIFSELLSRFPNLRYKSSQQRSFAGLGSKMLESTNVMSFHPRWIPRDRDRKFEVPLVAFMHFANFSECTKYRDRIFALRGLADPLTRKDIKVDYTISDGDVLMQVFPVLIRASGLIALQFGKLQKTPDRDLPSWMPDLGNNVFDGQWFLRFGANAEGKPAPWNAGGDPAEWAKLGFPKCTMPRIGAVGNQFLRFSHDYKTLACYGIEFDSIEVIEPASLYSRNDLQMKMKNMEEVGYKNSKDQAEHVERVVNAYHEANGGSPYGEEKVFVGLAYMAGVLPPMTGRARAQNVSEAERKMAINIGHEHTAMMCNNRTFIITKRGYVGLGPPDARRGDRVSVLFTANVPFILRPAEAGTFNFVGDSYVYGLCKGEILKWAKSMAKTIEEIWIQ